MRNKFDMQLDSLKEQLTNMGELCEVAITKATEAILEGKEEQAREVILADEEIDQAEKDIERLCLKLLLQQQPVAKDLRQISAALKMITDMERIGDQASDIAEILLSTDLKMEMDNKDIGVMAQAAAKMVRESVRAYVEQNMMLAKKVMTADDEVDRLFDKIRQEIIEYIAKENGDGGEDAVDLIMVAKYLERIGDHATNIAEWVEFSVTDGTTSKAEPDCAVTLFAGYPKAGKLEEVIRHSVELGVTEVVPFFSRYCVATPKKEDVKNERYNRIAAEAAARVLREEIAGLMGK